MPQYRSTIPTIMSLNNPTPGFGSVNEYLISGIPWVSSSTINGIAAQSFQWVASFFTVKNVSGSNSIKVGFTLNGVNGSNYFSLNANESYTATIRCKQLFISGSGNTVTIIAGLTTIPSHVAPIVTGSAGWPGVG